MTVFTFLLYASAAHCASPESTIPWMTTEGNNPKYSKWDSETGDSLRIASFSFLTIGFVAFVLVIRLILFEDRWVANIVTRFPKHPKQEDGAIKKDMKTDVYAFDLKSDSCEILD